MLKRVKNFLRHGGDSCDRVCCTKIENFGVNIGGRQIFSDVNIHIHCGELTAIIGPNGAGKSTLLKAILGQIPHSGKLKYVDAKDERTGKPVFGYVPQQLVFDKNSPVCVKDIFAAALSRLPAWLGRTEKTKAETERLLGRVKAEHLLERRLGALSGGELQRVLLALALNPLPDLLLLDEPVSGVDQMGLDIFYEMVSELRDTEDMAVILISHDLQTVKKYADKVVVLRDGKAVSGETEEIFANASVRSLFG